MQVCSNFNQSRCGDKLTIETLETLFKLYLRLHSCRAVQFFPTNLMPNIELKVTNLASYKLHIRREFL